jgi:hypothetical protein
MKSATSKRTHFCSCALAELSNLPGPPVWDTNAYAYTPKILNTAHQTAVCEYSVTDHYEAKSAITT